MKDRKAVADLRNNLHRSTQDDDDGRDQMYGDGRVAHSIARDVAMRHAFVPRRQIPARRRKPIEHCDRTCEEHLADDGHHKPEANGCLQSRVR